MRKLNKVSQLNRKPAHRKAMLKNMATSLFLHERISSTRAKLKAVKPIVEKIITRAKNANKEGVTPEYVLHQKREVLKIIKDRDVLAKIFDDIAKRFTDRTGGYTRMMQTANRISDNSEMGILELFVKKEKVILQEEKMERKLSILSKSKKEKLEEKIALKSVEKESKKDKKAKKDKKSKK